MADIDTGVIATSSIQLSDLYDVRPLSTFIRGNQPFYQLYNSADSSYNPDYTKNKLALTVVSLDPITHQESTSMITSVIWSYQYNDGFGTVTTTDTTKDWYISGDKGEILNIGKNFDSTSSGASFTALVSYTDTSKNTTATSSITVKVDLRNLVKSSILVNTYAPSGFNIVNSQPGQLLLSGDLYINGILNSSILRQNAWFRQDTSVTSVDNPLYDSRAGLGWAKVEKSNSSAVPNTEFNEKVTSNAQLNIFPQDIINVESYKLIVTPAEGEHEGSIQQGFYTTYNFDSAFTVTIQSPEGTVFKNGNGSKHLKAVIYNAVGEIDSTGTLYNYFWYLYKQGVLDTTFGGSGKKIGKTILVDSSEIDDNSSLVVEIDA